MVGLVSSVDPHTCTRIFIDHEMKDNYEVIPYISPEETDALVNRLGTRVVSGDVGDVAREDEQVLSPTIDGGKEAEGDGNGQEFENEGVGPAENFDNGGVGNEETVEMEGLGMETMLKMEMMLIMEGLIVKKG